MSFGVYVHIPFCAKKCPFCDFSVTTGRDQQSIASYFDHLQLEIQSCVSTWKHHQQIDTIFFGGGTPSLVNPLHIEKILHCLEKHFVFSQDIEITIECNPEDVKEEKLLLWQKMGINRFSLGVQHFDDPFLQKLGRVHTSQDVARAIELFHKHDIQNWSLDLIFGIEGQTLENWQATLQKALVVQPPHISTYELTIEEKTVFGKRFANNELNVPNDDTMAGMFAVTKKILEHAGYSTYETSNAAKNGFVSKHNVSCWKGDPYWGIGVSAHSRLISQDQIKRIENPKTYSGYMKTFDFLSQQQTSLLSEQDYVEECIWTGLRLEQGIPTKLWLDYQKELHPDFAKKSQHLIDQNILQIRNNHFRLAPQARIFADSIAIDLLS